MWKRSFRDFVPDFPHRVKVEDMETKLSCETSVNIWLRKIWKRSFRASSPSKSDSRRCENEAFVEDVLQILKVQSVKMKPELPVPMRGFPTHVPRHVWSCKTQHFFASTISQKRISCETSLKIWKLRMWKRSFRKRLPFKIWTLKIWRRSFRARRPSKSESGRYENEALVRDFPQKVQVEDVRTKLSCETSAKSESWRCENEAFVRDPLEKWKLKMWKRSFRARRLRKVKVEDVKTKLSCETSLKKWVKVEDVKTKLSCETTLKK